MDKPWVRPTSSYSGAGARTALVARTGAALLLLATAAIHVDLYVTGYRSIPTIGPLFLLQGASCVLVGLLLLVSAAPVAAALAAGLAASTLGGYLLSRAVGLFGFHEVATTAGSLAGGLELAVVVLGGGLALYGLHRLTLPVVGGASAAVAVGAVLLSLAAMGGSAPRPASPTASSSATTKGGSAKAVHVVIASFAFHPSHLAVLPGEWIVVQNSDSVTHTFTAMPATSPAGTFNTGPIAPGGSASIVAPMTPGIYAFYCSIHPFMTGVVTVRR